MDSPSLLCGWLVLLEDSTHLVVLSIGGFQSHYETFFVVIDAELFELAGVAGTLSFRQACLLLEDSNGELISGGEVFCGGDFLASAYGVACALAGL